MPWTDYVDVVGIAGALGFSAVQTRRLVLDARKRDDDRRTERALDFYRDLVVDGDTAGALTFVEQLASQGQDIGRLVLDLLEHLRALMLVQHMGAVPDSLPTVPARSSTAPSRRAAAAPRWRRCRAGRFAAATRAW